MAPPEAARPVAREDLWEALSEAFVDNVVDYAALARRVAEVPLPELEHVFFEEVAPCCGPNLMTSLPPVWSGFAREPLAAAIRERQAGLQASRLARLRHRLWVRYLRWHFAAEWRELAAHLG